jgi:hypothetical protein
MVAGSEKLVAITVPQGKGEDAIESIHTVHAPFFVPVNDHLSV